MNTLLYLIFAFALFFLLVFIIGMLLIRSYLKVNRRVYLPNERIITGRENGSSKILLLYQPSRNGTTVRAAQIVADTFNELGYQVVMNYPSAQLEYNISEFEKMVFISSVYMGKMAQPIYDFIQKENFMGREILLIAIGMATEEKKELDHLEKTIPEGNLIKKVKIIPEQISNLENWIKINL